MWKFSWAAGVGMFAAGWLLACGPDPEPARQTRVDQTLEAGWRFLGSDAAGAESTQFDDLAAGWSSISLPHTYNALDGQDGGSDYYRGPTWYRLHLPAAELLRPAARVGRRVYLEFDGANSVADVYVNGVHLGQHQGGFSRFAFDATDALSSSENVVAVRVDNSASADIPPLSADFTFFGGLYREVRLRSVDDLHVDLDDYGGSGVYLETRSVSAEGAELAARVRVTNASAQSVAASVTLDVKDGEQRSVAQLSGQVQLAAGATEEVSLSGEIPSPHLWDGRRDPYLHTATVQVSSRGQVTDQVSESFGFRSFSIDANTGFTLNGQPTDLHGVNRHQDRIDRGWALGTAEQDEDMALITEIGATALRLAHYQQSQYFYELSDRAGLVVWAEIPLVDGVTDSPAFAENSRRELRELIRQNYNHPSIVFWGIGNEQRVDDAPTNALLDELGQLVKTEDPTRISTYAHCCGSATSNLVSHADVTGYNVYYGWYMGNTQQFGFWADAVHASRPDTPIAVSEYGAGAGLSQHEEPPVQPPAAGLFHPEEYQTLLHEQTWAQMATRPFLWGKFVWNMFDFAVDTRNEGETPGRNDKGLVSYDRQTKKDAFYWYQANWSAVPMVHINGRRFEPRTTETVDIKVYSNASSVRLSVNGVNQAQGQRLGSFQYLWPAVALAPGENRVEAQGLGEADGLLASDSLVWTRQ